LDRVRLGFIGCGGIAQEHFKGIAQLPEAEMVAFCDLRGEVAEETAAKYGGRSFTDHAAMLAEVPLDAVYVILPPFAHGAPELAAVGRRLPFFVEKPVGNDLAVCREIAAEVRRQGLLTSVGYMTRYRESVQAAREVLAQDPPVVAYGGWVGAAPKMTSAIHGWWVTKEKSGGQLVEQTTHIVDLARYLMGEVVEVFASAARGFVTGLPNYTNDDASIVTLRFRSGALAGICSACCVDAGGGGVSLSICARQHTILFSGWNHTAKILSAGGEPREIPGEPEIFKIEDAAFLRAVRTGDGSAVLCQYADGLQTTEVTMAANRSMETRKAVELP
jgi:myo-inositol 2-dehydrogenase/D-chiro-inositol 1-dehydrogenase